MDLFLVQASATVTSLLLFMAFKLMGLEPAVKVKDDKDGKEEDDDPDEQVFKALLEHVKEESLKDFEQSRKVG
jgi:hypothetical protein